jgi:hypothetical protein
VIPRPQLLDALLRFCGVLFLLTVLGLAVLAVTGPESTSDAHCATSASHGC